MLYRSGKGLNGMPFGNTRNIEVNNLSAKILIVGTANYPQPSSQMLSSLNQNSILVEDLRKAWQAHL
jgi:hypothetical protein